MTVEHPPFPILRLGTFTVWKGELASVGTASVDLWVGPELVAKFTEFMRRVKEGKHDNPKTA